MHSSNQRRAVYVSLFVCLLVLSACSTGPGPARGAPQTASVCSDMDIAWEYEGQVLDVFYQVAYIHDLALQGSGVHAIGRWAFESPTGMYYHLDAVTGTLNDRRFWRGREGQSTNLRTVAAAPGSYGRVFLGGTITYLEENRRNEYGYATSFYTGSQAYLSAVGTRSVSSFGAGPTHYALSLSNVDEQWIQLHETYPSAGYFAVTDDALRKWAMPGASAALAVTDTGTVFSTGSGHILFRGSPHDFTLTAGQGQIVGTSVHAQVQHLAQSQPTVNRAGIVSGRVTPSDLGLAPDTGAYVAGAFREHGSDLHDVYIARFSPDGQEVWSWAIAGTEGGAKKVHVNPKTGSPLVAWSAASGALRVIELDPDTGSITDFRECPSQSGWQYELHGFAIDQDGNMFFSGNKPFDAGLPGGGRGFVLRARAP